ncbi:MAG TPA: histidine kinase [Puia sp.]|jgi:two-component system LytT family sensor kinase|nr:histidine kinase [Puia sp.]
MFRLNRKYAVFYHIGIWSVLFLCIMLWRSYNHGPRMAQVGNGTVVLIGLPYIVLYYLHAFWLMPVYLFRQRRTTYILLVLSGLTAVVLISGFLFYAVGLPPAGVTYFQSVTKRIFPGLFILMASASVGAFRENFRLEKLRKEKETEHLRTELAFLRGQVNPHFMLNVLNSMALLARRRSALLEPVLLELARLMNYMLYDAGNQMISLEDEISYLRAYIDLQLLRFGDDVTVRFNTPESIPPRHIEPMLFIPLVENAFKHGIGLVGDPIINIDIHANGDDRISIRIENKYNPQVRHQETRTQGIGLSNLRKRLDLVYPGDYDLQAIDTQAPGIWAKENLFITTLNIPLQ